jgi:hypothetical protein
VGTLLPQSTAHGDAKMKQSAGWLTTRVLIGLSARHPERWAVPRAMFTNVMISFDRDVIAAVAVADAGAGAGRRRARPGHTSHPCRVRARDEDHGTDASGDFDTHHFPDPTFGGMVPDFTQYKIDNFLVGGPPCAECTSNGDCDAFGQGSFFCGSCFENCQSTPPHGFSNCCAG